MRKDLVFIAAGGNTAAQFFGDILKEVVADCWSKPQPDVVYGLDSLPLQPMRRIGPRDTVIGRRPGITGVRALGHVLLTGKRPEERCIHHLRSSRLHDHASVPQRLRIESRGTGLNPGGATMRPALPELLPVRERLFLCKR